MAVTVVQFLQACLGEEEEMKVGTALKARGAGKL